MERNNMKHKEWIFLFLLVIATFLIGYTTGRKFPIHHYERLNDDVLFDPNTGKACVAFITMLPSSEMRVRVVYDMVGGPNSKKGDYLPACPK